MNILSISFSSIKFRKMNSIFNIVILAIGIATIITLLQFSKQLEQRFTRDLQGIDLVVGGKGSPIQLILSSVFHIDIPTGNIPLSEAENIKKNPLVKSAIPIAMGDNYKGFHIVGTNSDYIDHYLGKLSVGKVFTKEMEVVLGSEVVRKNSLKLGDKIIGAHGLVHSDDLHSDSPYTVVGILKPTNTVLDRLVLTPVESLWHVHEHSDHDDEGEEIEHKHEHIEKEITSLLISYKSPMAAVSLPRMINSSSSMQAASPAFEIVRLINILGVGSEIIILFGAFLVVIAAIGFFINLFNAVNDRRYDIALMRSLGASRIRILNFVLVEGMALGVTGSCFGIAIGYILNNFILIWVEKNKHVILSKFEFSEYEIYVFISAVVISIVATIIPAIIAYRTNIVKLLSRGS